MVRTLLALEAFVDVAFGVSLLVAPAILLSLYGMGTDRDGTFLARFLGATLVGFGVLCWVARAWLDTDARRALVRILFLTSSLGFLVCLAYELQPGAPTLTWAFVVLTLFFTVAWGYMARRMSEGAAT